jgi:hypothetical protein
MKRITRLMSAVMMIAVLTIVVSTTSCKKDNQSLSSDNSSALSSSSNSSALSEQQTASLRVDLVHVPDWLEDANKLPPSGDATLLWNNQGHVPILAPDGHQITLGEYNNVSGYAEVKCINAGTHVVIHLKGLIPNGVYTMWIVTFKSPGFDGTFVNQIGEGSLGAPDGSQNAFTASAAGTASLSVITPAESLSEFGSVGNCFSSEYEVQLAAAYHLDNLTHGGTPGEDPTTWVVPFAFPFKGGF